MCFIHKKCASLIINVLQYSCKRMFNFSILCLNCRIPLAASQTSLYFCGLLRYAVEISFFWMNSFKLVYVYTIATQQNVKRRPDKLLCLCSTSMHKRIFDIFRWNLAKKLIIMKDSAIIMSLTVIFPLLMLDTTFISWHIRFVFHDGYSNGISFHIIFA